jgi:hypothetical protein
MTTEISVRPFSEEEAKHDSAKKYLEQFATATQNNPSCIFFPEFGAQ